MKRHLLFPMACIFFLSIPAITLYAQKKEIRKTGSFTGIELSIPADLYLSQGNLTEVQLEGPEDYLAKVETVVSHGKLVIRFYSKFAWWKEPRGRIKVYISTPDISGLCVTGSGKIISKSKISTDDLSLSVTGSGTIDLSYLSAHELKSDVTGSGTIRIAGNEPVESQDILITGSGKVENAGLPSQKTKVSVTGSGKARVFAIERLKVSITGSGSVYYKGEGILDANITGSGDVVKMKE